MSHILGWRVAFVRLPCAFEIFVLSRLIVMLLLLLLLLRRTVLSMSYVDFCTLVYSNMNSVPRLMTLS